MSAPLTVQVTPARAVFASSLTESVVPALVKLLPDHRLLAAARLPVHLALVIERGPGMDAERRLEQAQQAARALLDVLAPEDLLSITVYGERAKLVLPAEPLGDGAKARRVLGFLDSQAVGLGTNLAHGMELATDDLRRHNVAAAVKRLFVIAASPQAPGSAAQERDAELLGVGLAEEGVGLSVLGLGPDWHARLLSRMADAGRGTVRHAPRPADAQPAGVAEGQLLSNLALADVRLRLHLARGVRMRRFMQVFPTLAHWLPLQPSERDLVARVGEMSSQQPRYMLVELVVPPQAPGTYRLATLDATFIAAGGRAGRSAPAELVVGFADAASDPNPEVAQHQEHFQAYSLVERALEARHDHDLPRARLLLGNARRIVPQRRSNALDAPLDLAVAALERGLPLTEGLAKALFVAAREPEPGAFSLDT